MSIVIQDRSPRVHYLAASGQTAFTVPFEWLKSGDIKAYVNGVRATFTSSPAGNAMQFSLSGTGVTGGGTLTFGPPGRLLDDEVIIFRDMPVARTSDLPTSGAFPVDSLNDELDATAAMIQQSEINVEQRSLRMGPADFLQTFKPLPTWEQRAGCFLAFDLNGQPVAVPPGGEIGVDSPGLLGRIWVSDTEPPQPWVHGMLWWKSNAGHLMLYYVDPNSAQWVQINFTTGSMAEAPPPPPPGAASIRTTLLTAASGSWSRDPDSRYYRIRGVGGGGGGGGVHTTNSPATTGAGSGGGSGGYGESEWISTAAISGGTYHIGQGGAGGVGNASGAPGTATSWVDGIRNFTFYGGAGGAPSGGYQANQPFIIRAGGTYGSVLMSGSMALARLGNAGDNSYSSPIQMLGGAGGSSPLGRGGDANYTTNASVPGHPANVGFGGGGGGAARAALAPADIAGGAGHDGAILVDEMF